MGSDRISSQKKIGALLLALTMTFAVAGCKKKVPPPPPPPKPVEQPKPAPPAKPAITRFEAEPSTVERGQASTLNWTVTGETTNISISPGIGTVSATGSRQVFPSNTTSYTISATGPGGSDSRTISVTVTQPPKPAPQAPAAPKATISERLAREVQDAYYDYDKSDLREDARATLTRDADALKAILNDFPGETITIEGHCDERGSAEYNIGLGDRRATAAKDFLVQLGVPGDRIKLVSYGKEKPQCTESNEECWQKNRRVHFVSGQ
jgi:peptidoglycan-associated lipoprotein